MRHRLHADALLLVPLPCFVPSAGSGSTTDTILLPGGKSGTLVVDARAFHVVGETLDGRRPRWAQPCLPGVSGLGGTGVTEFTVRLSTGNVVLWATERLVARSDGSRASFDTEGVSKFLSGVVPPPPKEEIVVAARALTTFGERVVGPLGPSTNPASLEWTVPSLALVAGIFAASLVGGWPLVSRGERRAQWA